MRLATSIATLFFLMTQLVSGEGVRTPQERPDNPPIVLVEASCASLCQQRHNQCRISTRGSARCDAELQRCLKGCLATKRR